MVMVVAIVVVGGVRTSGGAGEGGGVGAKEARSQLGVRTWLKIVLGVVSELVELEVKEQEELQGLVMWTAVSEAQNPVWYAQVVRQDV